MNKNNLLPCPFCGKAVMLSVVDHGLVITHEYASECVLRNEDCYVAYRNEDCAFYSPRCPGCKEYKERLIRAWNTRSGA